MTANVNVNARPYLHGHELAAMIDAVRAGQFGHGPITDAFEEALARFLDVPDMVAVSTCTAALSIALLAAGVGPGDTVPVPSQTFVSSVRAIQAVGATPHFVDVDPATLCVTGELMREAITPSTRAIIPVLYGGRAVDLTDARDLIDRYGVAVVEDAAHAFGSHHGNRLVGATGRLTCFSFGPIKNLTCIEGGAIVPRDPAEAELIRRLRILGITQSQADRIRTTTYTIAGDGGLRATLSSVHAAVGLAQLDRFAVIAEQRQQLWRAYAGALRGIDGITLIDVDVARTVPFNCVVRVDGRDRVHAFMRDSGIGVGVHYPPCHLQPAFARWRRSLPATEETGQQILSLPFHPYMTVGDVDHVAAVLTEAIGKGGMRRASSAET